MAGERTAATDTGGARGPRSTHEVVTLLEKGAEFEPRQENQMTQSGRGARDSRGWKTGERKERVSGSKRRALVLGERGDWETDH